MALQWILVYWRLLLIVMLFGLLSLQTVRLNSAQHALQVIAARATIAKEQSDANLTTLQAAIPVMVDQVKTNAWANAKARFAVANAGTGNAACGIRADGLLPNLNSRQDANPGGPGEAIGERLVIEPDFIDACARDAGRLDLWIAACKSNPFICEIKE